MPVTEMIQRVAQAIEAAELKWKAENGGDDASCVDCPDEIKARAAVEAIREPTEKMLVAARDWSAAKYGKPIGNDAATGCWQTMQAAILES